MLFSGTVDGLGISTEFCQGDIFVVAAILDLLHERTCSIWDLSSVVTSTKGLDTEPTSFEGGGRSTAAYMAG